MSCPVCSAHVQRVDRKYCSRKCYLKAATTPFVFTPPPDTPVDYRSDLHVCHECKVKLSLRVIGTTVVVDCSCGIYSTEGKYATDVEAEWGMHDLLHPTSRKRAA